MNFLTLCQKVFLQGGISGQITSTQNQTGEALRIVNFVQDSYREILNSDQFTFGFIRKEVHKQLVPGQGTYTKAELDVSDLGQWDTTSMRVSSNEDRRDETFIIGQRWPAFRDYWRFSTRRYTTSRPLNCAINQDTNLEIGPVPDAAYWLTFQYIDVPTDLLEDGDIPVIPDRWQMAIVWRALMLYGGYEAASEAYARGQNELTVIQSMLEIDQLPMIRMGGPLA